MKRESSHPADELLVMDAQDGDRRSMHRLVERWQKRLWAHAYRLTADADAAWDITQETWLAIIKGLRRLHDPAKFRQWAYRIATNKAMDVLKARYASRAIASRPATGATVTDQPDSGLSELLARLDPGRRVVLALYYLEGLSVAEVGAVLDIPAGTVKSRLHNARNELKRLWRQDVE